MSRTLASERSMSARWPVISSRDVRQRDVGLVEDPVDPGPRLIEVADQLAQLGAVLLEQDAGLGGGVAEVGDGLGDPIAVVLDRAVELGDERIGPCEQFVDLGDHPVEPPRGIHDGGACDLGRAPDVIGGLLEGGEDLLEPGGDVVDRLPDLGDRVAEVIALGGSQADLLQERVEEGALDPLDRLARDPGDARLADRGDVDARLAGQAGLDGHDRILIEPGGELAADRDPGPWRGESPGSRRRRRR